MSNDNHPPTQVEQESQPQQDALFPADEHPWADARHRDDLIFDHGIHWCDRAGYHPEHHGGYPHLDHDRTECRSRPGLFPPGRLDLTGPPAEIEVYCARSFDYGNPRSQFAADVREQTRLVLAAYTDDQPLVRFSLPITEARNLARYLDHLSDVVDGYVPAWMTPQPQRRL
jgi:hypothetical protein